MTGACSLLMLATASCLCLWLSWTSTATTRTITSTLTTTTTNYEQMASGTSTNNVHNELYSIITKMATLTKQDNATCTHPSNNTNVEWMVSVESGSLRTNIPLQQAVTTPSSLLITSDTIHKFQVCRRDCCISGGTCLDETFAVQSPSSNMIDDISSSNRTCETPSDVSTSLKYGAWNRDAMSKQETWNSFECQLPHKISPPTRKPQRVLFIGDSTLQELALLTAQAARSTPNTMGIRNDVHLNCTCPTDKGTTVNYPGSTKDCRTFDATGRYLNTSMLWAGHKDCFDNRMGVNVVDDVHWKSMVVAKVEEMQPNTIFFQVPISHSCVNMDSCVDALDRYICFITSLQQESKSTQIILLITGAAISRFQSEGPTGRHCPSALRRWIAHIKNRMARSAPHVTILDIFTPTEQWLDLTARKDPFVPACRSMQRHLTCDFTSLDFSKAIDSPFYVLPPGRLAEAAIMKILELDSMDGESDATRENECRAITTSLS